MNEDKCQHLLKAVINLFRNHQVNPIEMYYITQVLGEFSDKSLEMAENDLDIDLSEFDDTEYDSTSQAVRDAVNEHIDENLEIGVEAIEVDAEDLKSDDTNSGDDTPDYIG